MDPDLAETGQPYAFTGDDPLNATDPLGLKKKKRQILPPCSNAQGGVYHNRGKVGDLEMEQDPETGRVRFNLVLNSYSLSIVGPTITVSGSMSAITPNNKALSSHYAPHPRAPTYNFHSSLGNVPSDSTVTVDLNGVTPSGHGVTGFTVYQQCTTVLGSSP